MLVTVTDKGQLTVPKAIRDRFGITPGSKLDFEVLADGTLRVRVLTRGAGGLFGLLRQTAAKAKPRTVEEMDAGIAEAVAVRARRAKA